MAAGTDGIEIGLLRWRVTIGRRPQAPDAGISVIESLINPMKVWANVQQLAPITIYNSQQVDTPFTHRISMRWLSYLDNTWVVIRETKGTAPLGFADYGTSRIEIFRVRRVGEWQGRKRYTILECEMERFL